MLLNKDVSTISWDIANNNALFIVVSVIVFIQLLLSFQGFDLCDEGFSLSFYQQIYNTPESVEYNFVYWLSGLVGGLWYELYENGGILWFRLLAIIINTLTFIISYRLLVIYINKWHALVGLLMVLFVNDFGYMVFYHNHLSALLVVSSVFFLMKGIVKTNLLYIAISGLFFTVNIFSRVPNVLLGIHILAIPFYYSYLQQKPFKSNIKPMLSYVLGAMIGLILIVVLLYSLNQLSIMKQSFLGIIDSGVANDSNHNFVKLIKVNIDSYKKVATQFLKFSVVFFVLIYFLKEAKNNKLYKTLLIVGSLILFFVMLKNNSIYTLYGFILFGTLGLIIFSQNDHIKLLSLLSLIMEIIMPMGSDGSIHNVGYASIWLGLPLFFNFNSIIKKCYSVTEIGHKEFRFSVSEYSIKLILTLLVVSYFASKAYNISQEAYFDLGSRFEKRHTINSDFARHIYTTEDRANITNELLVNLKRYVRPNDVLFAYDNIPMIHFLTNTKPYIYNPWVWIYDTYSFEKKLKKAEGEFNELPIIVQQKFETIVKFSEPLEDYMSENKKQTFIYNGGRNKVMNKFIKRNEYKIVWSNPYFNIYKANKSNGNSFSN